jgi:hypothetical protein
LSAVRLSSAGRSAPHLVGWNEVLFAVIIRRVKWRIGLVLLLAAGGLCGCGASAARAPGARVAAGGTCDTAVASATTLRAVSAVAVAVPGNPFGVVVTADGVHAVVLAYQTGLADASHR